VDRHVRDGVLAGAEPIYTRNTAIAAKDWGLILIGSAHDGSAQQPAAVERGSMSGLSRIPAVLGPGSATAVLG
jgi:hypothetical protein